MGWHFNLKVSPTELCVIPALTVAWLTKRCLPAPERNEQSWVLVTDSTTALAKWWVEFKVHPGSPVRSRRRWEHRQSWKQSFNLGTSRGRAGNWPLLCHSGRDWWPWAELEWESWSMGRVHWWWSIRGLGRAREAFWCPQGLLTPWFFSPLWGWWWQHVHVYSVDAYSWANLSDSLSPKEKEAELFSPSTPLTKLWSR